MDLCLGKFPAPRDPVEMETKRRWAALGIAIAPLFATSPGKVTDAAFVLGRLVHLSPDFLSPAWVPKESNTSNPASNLFKPTKPVLSKSFCKGKGKEGHRLEKDYRVSRAPYKSDVLENENIQECCIRMVVGLGCNTNRCFTWYYWHVLSIDKVFSALLLCVSSTFAEAPSETACWCIIAGRVPVAQVAQVARHRTVTRRSIGWR